MVENFTILLGVSYKRGREPKGVTSDKRETGCLYSCFGITCS